MEGEMQSEDLQRKVLQSTLEEVAKRDEDSPDCCVICLEAITETCELKPCGHRSFDYLCIASWLFETPKCPLCKTSAAKLLHGPPDNIQTTLFDQAQETRQPSAQNSASVWLRDRAGRNRPRRPRPRHDLQDDDPDMRLQRTIMQRQQVYRLGLYSKHVGSNRMSRYRELTPQMFCADNELVSRARTWIRRELRVFSFLNPEEDGPSSVEAPRPSSISNSSTTLSQRRRANNAEFLLEYIVAILKSVDMMGSAGQAEEMLSDFLGRDNTKLFLHELRAWLRSPYTKLEDWDRAVQYDSIPTRSDREAGSSTSGDSRKLQGAARGSADCARGGGDYYRPGRASRTRDSRPHYGRREPYSRR